MSRYPEKQTLYVQRHSSTVNALILACILLAAGLLHQPRTHQDFFSPRLFCCCCFAHALAPSRHENTTGKAGSRFWRSQIKAWAAMHLSQIKNQAYIREQQWQSYLRELIHYSSLGNLHFLFSTMLNLQEDLPPSPHWRSLHCQCTTIVYILQYYYSMYTAYYSIHSALYYIHTRHCNINTAYI